MLRTIFMIGLFALIGLLALKLVFNILGPLFAILLWALFLALKIAIVGFVIYLIVRVVSPDTARRWKEKFSGTTMAARSAVRRPTPASRSPPRPVTAP
jgi:hypothetical protein